MAEDYNKSRDTELILPPGVFAFVLDETKARINTLCGPNKSNLSNTDKLVTYNPETKRYITQVEQRSAIQTNIMAPKGHYVILENPSSTGKQPEPGNQSHELSIDLLKMGQVENIPGPVSFPLWPSQVATVIRGHHLRSNQYLLVRVYDDEAAKANWDKSVVKAATSEGSLLLGEGVAGQPQESLVGINKESLVTGQLMIIKGTEVTFYIPATGIEVLKDEDGKYVRDAVTLERLEYSILLDESGNKEYVRGPAVVFPQPTQQFITSKTDGNKRKFRAFELQSTSGIYVKVIADYEEAGKAYKAGEELFITGNEQAIYYPRPEHALITYGNQEKYYAVAVPGGEGRYVLNRTTGEVKLIKGPSMFLPNPIAEVIVRRILSDTECSLYYPGNFEVLTVNQELRKQSGQDSSFGNLNAPISLDSTEAISFDKMVGSALRSSNVGYAVSPRESSSQGLVADALSRGTKFTPPRSIVLNSKFEGAPRIEVFSGYAIQVVDSRGERATIIGPAFHLLEYDEKLERLSLSKGKPKSSDNRIDTVYLKHISNPVSDILTLKTQDLVDVKVGVKYLVRFEEAQKDDWFSVDNYVQYLVDHLRSLIGNAVRSVKVQDFYAHAADILRDTVLGVKSLDGVDPRPLKRFTENGMTVYDLELISIEIQDSSISNLLSKAQQQILSDSVERDMQQERMTLTKDQELAKRTIAQELAATKELTDQLRAEEIKRSADASELTVVFDNKLTELRVQGKKEYALVAAEVDTIGLQIKKASSDLDEIYAESQLKRNLSLLEGEGSYREAQLKAIQPGLVEALMAASNAGILEKVAPTIAALGFTYGKDLESTLDMLLKGTAAEGVLSNLKRLSVKSNGTTLN